MSNPRTQRVFGGWGGINSRFGVSREPINRLGNRGPNYASSTVVNGNGTRYAGSGRFGFGGLGFNGLNRQNQQQQKPAYGEGSTKALASYYSKTGTLNPNAGDRMEWREWIHSMMPHHGGKLPDDAPDEVREFLSGSRGTSQADLDWLRPRFQEYESQFGDGGEGTTQALINETENPNVTPESEIAPKREQLPNLAMPHRDSRRIQLAEKKRIAKAKKRGGRMSTMVSGGGKKDVVNRRIGL